MYYDPETEIVVDYHGGIKDARKKLLRMIGDPVTRYREDPVRIIRAVRFAAKLGFEIEPKTRAPIRELARLLDDVPQSRMFDEMLKLLQTGHALAIDRRAEDARLHRGVYPVARRRPRRSARHDSRECRLADTDRRVNEGKPVAPSFLLAACSGTTCATAGRQRQEAGSPRSPPCRTRSTTCSTPASATSPAAASWPSTCARSG